ncbi:uncharacterized protein LOC101855020 [Aplysia californica]|uniref:Uncharacterized protein LOC101855020 n=1 Tax=Aplysia californica TaxID=6500 RepID=A0ABM0JP83_APLCA|nr:uncharacterized protein LOC101855020 [Aplysia californica]
MTSFQGLGLTRLMLEDLRSHFLSLGVRVRREMMVTKGTELAASKPSFSEEYKERLTRDILCYDMDSHDQEQYLHHCEGDLSQSLQCHVLDAARLEEMSKVLHMSTKPTERQLVVNWTPLCLQPENIPKLCPSNGYSLISFAFSERESASMFESFANINDSHSFTQGKTTQTTDIQRPEEDSCHTEKQPIRFEIGAEQTESKSSHMMLRSSSIVGTSVAVETSENTNSSLAHRNFSARSDNDFRYQSHQAPALLSFGNFFQCRLGLAYNLDLHLLNLSDRSYYIRQEELTHHLLLHVRKAFEVSAGVGGIHFLMFLDCNPGLQRCVKEIMEGKFRLRRGVWSSAQQHLYIKKIV